MASHALFPGSELWANVPVPSVPSQEDVSGLGVPSPTYIPGYVWWSRLEQGPKTKVQDHADTIAALILSVHPLEIQDCKAPSPKEVDKMRVRASGTHVAVPANCVAIQHRADKRSIYKIFALFCNTFFVEASCMGRASVQHPSLFLIEPSQARQHPLLASSLPSTHNVAIVQRIVAAGVLPRFH